LSIFLLGIGYWIGLPSVIEDEDVLEGAKNPSCSSFF